MSHARLLQLSAQPYRLLAKADGILAEPVYADTEVLAEKLRELIADIQANMEEKLDEASE